jgi:hypothetical protein
MTRDELAELAFLRSTRAIRARAEEILAEATAGRSAHFDVDLSALPPLAARVLAIAKATYPDLSAVPVHGRFRHFQAGGVDRVAHLDDLLRGAGEKEKLAARADLVVTSVLLDAGAGGEWSYREASTGQSFERSEGLAVASFTWFVEGGLSDEPARAPLRADPGALRRIDAGAIERAFQVHDRNPLVGVEGRASLLRRLGERDARPGQLAVDLFEHAAGAPVPAHAILERVLEELGPIWPGREALGGVPLGDVWTHSRLGRVPFHKLSQWLSYSMFEPLERVGIRVVDPDSLTGLAEYRNGGLFVDGGVIVPKYAAAVQKSHAVGSDLVIEWRGLTVALLDRIADEVRRLAGLGPAELPLAKVLEAGTWRAGRLLAAERRAGAVPPIRVDSDGTVF